MSIATFNNRIEPLTTNALRHAVVRKLLEALLRGELPAETRLVAQKLAKELGISATPVREALLELKVLGIVEFYHNRGAVTKEFGRKQIAEIYHLRRILEAEATRCAVGRIPFDVLVPLKNETLALLDREKDESWSREAMEVDQKLHTAITNRCGNPRLSDEINRYALLTQIIREVAGNRQEAQTVALRLHLDIIDAMLAGDAVEAGAAMERHINATTESVVEIIFPDK